MSIEHTSPTESQQEAWLTQASSHDIQHTQESENTGNKLHKINNILWVFDLSDDQEDKYTKSLKKLDKGQLSIVQKLDKYEFEELLSKPQIEISQSLIQAQIEELEKSDDPDFDKLDDLQTQLIAVEKQETENQNKLIDAIDKTDSKITGLRNALLKNVALSENLKTDSLRSMIQEVEDASKNREGFTPKQLENLQEKIAWKFESIIVFLQKPWNLESIAKDLGWTDSKEYIELKAQLISVEPDLRSIFDRVEADFADKLAMTKLWTDNLDWVDTDKNILIKQEWDLSIEAWKTDRNLSLEWSNYKLPSKLDSKYENRIEGLHQQFNKELAPFNTELKTLSSILKLIKTLETSGVRFDETKTHIRNKHPETYNTLGLSWKNTFNELMSTIHAHMAQLTKSKKKITKKTILKLKRITAQNKKEAEKKDRATEEMLRFFNEIGLDIINQDTFTQIISMVNLNPHSYGLQQPIDLENSNLGFDFDFWNNSMSLLEKKAFIGFVNKMLWEDIINEDIANGITTLQPESVSRLRVLNNKTIGYFISNLNMWQS